MADFLMAARLAACLDAVEEVRVMIVLSDVHLAGLEFHPLEKSVGAAFDLAAGRHGRDPALLADEYASEVARQPGGRRNCFVEVLDHLPVINQM